MVAIEIERSTSPERTNPIREELRHEAYRLLGTALRTAGPSPMCTVIPWPTGATASWS